MVQEILTRWQAVIERSTGARRLSALLVVTVAIAWFPVAGAAEPEDDADVADTDWRVERASSEKPPVQVRRALDVVVPSARSVAESVARDRNGGRAVQPRADQTEDGSNDSGEDAGSATTVATASTADASSAVESEETVGGETTPPRWNTWLDDLWEGASRAALGQQSGGQEDGESAGTLTAEPYVEDRRWRRAMRLVKDGDCKQALDLVDAVIEGTDRDLKEIRGVRYAVARIKMCTPGYGERGRRTMRQLAGGEDAVAELARRRLGLGRSPVESASGEGETEAPVGLPSYILDENSARTSGPSTNDVIREARERAREGDVDRAVERLQTFRHQLDDDWSRFRTYEVQGSILWRAGRRAEAARAFRGAYKLARAWNRGSDLETRLDRLERQSGVRILTMGDRVDRMRELIHRGEYHRAKQVSIDNAEIAGVKGSEIEGWSYFRRGLEAEQRRDRDKAAELFEKAEERVDSPVIRPRLYYGWARALRRIDRDTEAIKLYDRLCREFPEHHLADDARYHAGRLSVYDNDFEEARGYFADVVGLHPASDYHADALWLGAFSAYLQGDYADVERPLQALREAYGDQLDSSGTELGLKARYWQAVAALKLGEADRAERGLQGVITENPLSWYGRLAAARLENLGVAPVVPLPPAELTPADLRDLSSLKLPDLPAYQVAGEYAKIGLYEDAAEDIKRQLDVEPSPPGARHLLATLWLLSGDVHRSHWMMNDYLASKGPTLFDMRTWGLAYPVEYFEESRRWGEAYRVDPLLVQSVIRQESGFREGVASYVGAVGLMQLMPGTANYASDEFFDGAWLSRSDLRTPNTNVRYGTAYMRAMLGYTRENVPMALAGYNAGPEPLRSWFQRYGDREVDAWVESLTYEQARGYVRKVYTNYVRYTALYAGRSRPLPTPSLELPSEFAPWGEEPELQNQQQTVSQWIK